MLTCGAGRCAFSSCWVRSLSLPHSPAPRINGLRLDRSSRRLRLPDISSTSEGTGCICGAPGMARLPSSSTRASAARALTGALSSLMLPVSRASAPTTGQAWVTAIPARRRGPHAASRASCTTPRPQRDWRTGRARRRLHRGFRRPRVASDHPDRAAGLVLVDASHEDDAHEVPRMARFVPLLSTLGVFDCSACRSAFKSNRSRHQCGNSRRRRVSAQPDTRRRPTRLFTFGRARRKSGARAASSPSLSSSSPVAGSRRELATAAKRSSLAVRPRMPDRRATVRPRRGGRPTRGRCGRDPDRRGDSQRR